MIAHRISTIKTADYIYLFDGGNIVDSGTWDELVENKKGWFWDICETQGIK
jgi:ABC-type multidrug transport system fused ATPase/permease subunit